MDDELGLDDEFGVEDELAVDDDPSDEDAGLLDRLRQMPVGVTDPNIIGDAGPTDIPPGSDPPVMSEDDGAV